MLAIQLVKIEWLKDSRTPDGARQRALCLQPEQIASDVSLVCPAASEEAVFLQRRSYYQSRGQIKSAEENVSGMEQRHNMAHSDRFTAIDDYAEKRILRAREHIQAEMGGFLSLEKLDIPCLAITAEQDNAYRVKWYDSGEGMPKRRGGNEDFGKNGAKLAGRPNTLNETAFVLKQGESGVARYNYRYTGYHGQWYRCYYVYLVNADSLDRDIFLREYDYEYGQLADLF